MNRRQLCIGLGGGLLAGPITPTHITAATGPLVGTQFTKNVALWSKGQATALCIGISKYPGAARLHTPKADALTISKGLSRAGFTTRTLIDPTFKELNFALSAFAHLSKQAELTVIYVAGHGIQFENRLHLLPIDAFGYHQIFLNKLVSETALIRATSDRPRQRVLLLDCCRQPPKTIPTSCKTRQETQVDQAGIFISYAAQDGAPAFDGIDGHSPFAAGLIRSLKQPYQDLESAARSIRRDVIKQTQGLQIPWLRSSLVFPISFAGPLQND